jgi:hypothetical protein
VIVTPPNIFEATTNPKYFIVQRAPNHGLVHNGFILYVETLSCSAGANFRPLHAKIRGS